MAMIVLFTVAILFFYYGGVIKSDTLDYKGYLGLAYFNI